MYLKKKISNETNGNTLVLNKFQNMQSDYKRKAYRKSF